MEKIRQSNFELLRIVAIIMVMIVHANFGALGAPTHADAVAHPILSFGRVLLQQCSSVCVNLFILISGYFCIKPKWKSVFNFLFLVFFWRLMGLLISICGGDLEFTTLNVLHSLNPMRVWFIREYLTLMLFAPFINAFCEKCETRQLVRYVGVYMCLMLVGDHLLPLKEWGLFRGGYSFFAFVGLYLIGRILSRAKDTLNRFSFGQYIAAYWVLSLIGALVLWLSYRFVTSAFLISRMEWSLQTYTGPIVMACSVVLFLAFSQINFTSKLVNNIARSVFAIFLAHCPVFYAGTIKRLASTDDTWCESFGMIAGFIVLVFVATVIIDQVRLLIWKNVISRVEMKRC